MVFQITILLVIVGFYECQNVKTDTSFFTLHSSQDVMFLLAYVDDLILTRSNATMMDAFLIQFNSMFSLRDMGFFIIFLVSRCLIMSKACIYHKVVRIVCFDGYQSHVNTNGFGRSVVQL